MLLFIRVFYHGTERNLHKYLNPIRSVLVKRRETDTVRGGHLKTN